MLIAQRRVLTIGRSYAAHAYLKEVLSDFQGMRQSLSAQDRLQVNDSQESSRAEALVKARTDPGIDGKSESGAMVTPRT